MEVNRSPKAAEIAACARALISTRGYNGFSYADIAEAVGISKPSVHHHFPSKAELVRSVVAAYREEARVGLAALNRRIPDPLERLRAWLGFWHTCLHDRTLPFCICAMLAIEMPVIPAEIGVEVRGHLDDLCGWLEALLAEGVQTRQFVLRRPAPQEALSLMAAVHGAMVSSRAYDDPAVFDTIAATVVAGLTRAP